jgi:hypothetical protein
MSDGSTATFALAFHADYGCRERGACCTAGWPIPVERAQADAIEAAARNGRLDSTGGWRPLLSYPAHAPAETPALLGVTNGACIFHRPSGTGRCQIHRALGPAALPLACRQFPRVSVHDPRGISITLSHFCPTAADLLRRPLPAGIVTSPPAFPLDGEYVGLDARQALPPLLRSDMLMDWESWWLFERLSVAAIARAASTAGALQSLRRAVAVVEPWRPDDGPLGELVSRAFSTDPAPAGVSEASDVPAVPAAPNSRLVEAVLAAIPDSVRPTRRDPSDQPDGAPTPDPSSRVRFLAAHAFANWTAHLGDGLRTWLRSVEAADAVLTHVGSVRTADLWLRHLVDPKEMARELTNVG